MATLFGQFNQILGVLQHLCRGRAALKVAQKYDANALAIVAGRMGALQSKAATLVHLAIASYNEIVANVAETPSALVIRLYVLNQALALLRRGAPIGIIRVVDDHIFHSAVHT